jgi:heme/copper-type cytochrome/quinol oxidase subunit 3
VSVTTEVHVHHDDPETVGRRERFGVVLLIVADIAFVGCLMFSYMYLRFLNVNGAWLPEEITPALTSPTWLVAGALVVGAAVFTWGTRSLRAGNQRAFLVAGVIALLVAVAALVLQIMQLRDFNFPAGEKGYFASGYSSSMVTLAGANAFHILLTIFITLGIVNRTRLGLYRSTSAWQPRFAMYWWVWIAISAVLVGLMTTFLVATPSPPSMG